MIENSHEKLAFQAEKTDWFEGGNGLRHRSPRDPQGSAKLGPRNVFAPLEQFYDLVLVQTVCLQW